MSLSLRRLRPDDLPDLQGWYDDPELARRLTGPTDEWFEARFCACQEVWVAVDDTGTVAAEMQVERDGGMGYIAMAVRPRLRHRGLGTAALAAFVAGPGRQYVTLEGRIEPDNLASLACVRKCGFRLLDERDEDGLIRACWANPAWQAA